MREGESATGAIFETHAVAVMSGLEECGRCWAELVELGVPVEDLGLVLGGMPEPARPQADGPASTEAREAPRVEDMLRGIARFQELAPAADGARLFASGGYPADLLDSLADGAERSSVFEGLLPVRAGVELSAAIARGDPSIWVRTSAPAIAAQAVALLLRRSPERVRTFLRPGREPPDAPER